MYSYMYICNTQYSELSTNLSKLELVQRSLLVEVVLLDLAQDLLPGGGTASNMYIPCCTSLINN